MARLRFLRGWCKNSWWKLDQFYPKHNSDRLNILIISRFTWKYYRFSLWSNNTFRPQCNPTFGYNQSRYMHCLYRCAFSSFSNQPFQLCNELVVCCRAISLSRQSDKKTGFCLPMRLLVSVILALTGPFWHVGKFFCFFFFAKT